MATLNIMDVSKWQGTINWDKVKASGKVDGVMLRVLGTKGGKPYVDPYFEVNYKACVERGIPVGAYYYSAAIRNSEANIELALLRRTILGKKFQLPIAVDIEHDSQKKLGKQKLTDLVAYELSMIESWGVYTTLYANLDFCLNYLFVGGAALKKYDVWLAAHRTDKTKPTTGFAFGMWQHTRTGSVSGANGDVDMSYAYKNYPAIIKKAGLELVK